LGISGSVSAEESRSVSSDKKNTPNDFQVRNSNSSPSIKVFSQLQYLKVNFLSFSGFCWACPRLRGFLSRGATPSRALRAPPARPKAFHGLGRVFFGFSQPGQSPPFPPPEGASPAGAVFPVRGPAGVPVRGGVALRDCVEQLRRRDCGA